MKKPGILFVINCLAPGGAELFIRRLAVSLRNKYNISIYTLLPDMNDEAFLKEFLNQTGAVVLRKTAKLSRFQEALFSRINAVLFMILGKSEFYIKRKRARERRHLLHFFRKHNIKFINSHLISSDHFAVNFLKPLTHCPVVITMHSSYNPLYWKSGPHIDKAFLQKAEEILLKADRIVCVSEINREIFEHIGQHPAGLPEKIYLGYKKPEHFANMHLALEKAEGKFVFCMMGRGIPEKGWIHAVRAFERLKMEFPEIMLLLVGPLTPYLLALKEEHSQTGLIFTDFVGNVESILPFIHAGLLPSHGESLPYSIIEMLAFGKPVIATDVGEIRQMLDTGCGENAGFVIDLKQDGTADEEQLYLCMRSYLEKPDLYNTHSGHALIAFKRFDMDETAAAYDHIFQSLMSKKK